ncbi:uncharacterized protein METZ01_LOCUS235967, partial [marine metagenome]|jgi:phenylpropionate dioxygenase-like ring-hydroxylating dioxygenase large terminal subunit|tara:strand:- start:24518 stop:24871 length:354 start_codon:yes stop_codon:yes gene_type:complete
VATGADGEHGWVRVADASLVAGSTAEATLDDQDLVIWRTTDGRPCVMEARCPHQWSHLGGEGVVEGDELVCLTHLWRFTTEGEGWKLNVGGRRDRKGDIRTWPCREDADGIWVSRGD